MIQPKNSWYTGLAKSLSVLRTATGQEYFAYTIARASVSEGDHLIFGEDDGRLETVPALERRMRNWKTDLGAGISHWRCTRNRINGQYFQAKGYRHSYRSRTQALQWDDFQEISRLARDSILRYSCMSRCLTKAGPFCPKKSER